MISQQDMLDIILTEAVEDVPPAKEDSPKIQYNLRLVRHEDGRLEWRDD